MRTTRWFISSRSWRRCFFAVFAVCLFFLISISLSIVQPQYPQQVRDPVFAGGDAATTTVRLDEQISSLHSLSEVLGRHLAARRAFERIYTIRTDTAQMVIPPEFRARVLSMFSSYGGRQEDLLRIIENQRIVEIRNRITGEHAFFNDIRKFRAGAAGDGAGTDATERAAVKELYTRNSGAKLCDFCSRKRTAEDVFGRIIGNHSYTASNVAKLSKWHTLIITNVHDPLAYDNNVIADLIGVSHKWFKRAHENDSLYMYPNIICDIGKKASASQEHFHLQMFLTRDQYFSGASQLQRAALRYAEIYNTNYWDELIRLHKMIGLAVHVGNSVVLSSICPRKEKELIVLCKDPEDASFTRAIALALMTLRDAAGVQSLSFGISYPPLDESGAYSLGEIPAIFRVIDRGNVFDPRSDTGALEYFGSPYIASDPYAIVSHLLAAK